MTSATRAPPPPASRLPQSASLGSCVGFRHALSAARASPRASPRASDVARATLARTNLAPTSSPTRRVPRRGARPGARADQPRTPLDQAPREGASVAGDGGAAETPSFVAAIASSDAITAEGDLGGGMGGGLFADGFAPPRWPSSPPQQVRLTPPLQRLTPPPLPQLATQGYSPAASLSPPYGARQVNSWTPQGWLRAAPRDAAPESLESPEGGVARAAALSSSFVLARQLTAGPPPGELGAARALLLEGRAAEAVELVWRQLAGGEAGEAGAAAAAVELLGACEENAVRLLGELGREQAQAVVGFVAEELKAERSVPQLLPWLETALRLRTASGGEGGRDLFAHAAYKSLSRTLRGLSASADASGIHAAKLFALLQAAPAPSSHTLARGAGARPPASGAPARAAWLD